MKIALVSTQGGHITEILQLINAFEGHEFFFVTHHSIRDDEIQAIASTYYLENMAERPLQSPYIFYLALKIILRENPDAILSLGADITLPFFLWGKLLRLKTIFIESFCRTENLSRTGRIAYWIVDVFWVQWPQVLNVSGPKARYMGSVV